MFYLLISLLLNILSPSSLHTNIGIDLTVSQVQTTISNYKGGNDTIQEIVHSSFKNRRKVVNSIVVAIVIVLVALTPKLLLIYCTIKKEKNEKLNHQNDIPLHHKINPDLYYEELRGLVIKNDPLFFKRFRESYPDIVHNILIKHPDLINSELTLCAMIYLNFSAKEIAAYSFIQHRSVQTNRSRLRKKMKLSSQVNLDQYIRSFNQ